MRNIQTTYKPASAENVSFNGTAANFTPPNDVYAFRILATQNCYLNWDTTATSANSVKVSANQYEYFACDPGEPISIIQDSAGGVANIAWMTN